MTCGDTAEIHHASSMPGICFHHSAEFCIHFRNDIFLRPDCDIHFIYEHANRNAPFAEHLIQSTGMRLNSLRSADHQKRIVDHRQSALHLCSKIYMSGSVYHSDISAAGSEPGLSGKHSDAAVPLYLGIVKKGIAVVHPARFSDLAGPVEQRL